MMPLDYVLAVAVLTAPIQDSEIPNAPEYASVMRTIRQVAISWELLDPREASYFLQRGQHFEYDIDLLRRRYARLADAPYLAETDRFPSKHVAGELLSFNRTYHRQLQAKHAAIGPARSKEGEALGEAERLYAVWDLLRDASSDCYYVTARRQSLADLRRTLGDAAFAKGEMPPHVPVWRFARRD